MTTLGKYTLGPLLGQGGMGAVYRSHHPQLNRPVAVKVLSDAVAADSQAIQRFIREAQVVAGLSHPGIINILDVDVDASGRPFIVMELLEHGSLSARLRQGTVSLDEALRLGAALADALEYAHRQGLVHRDLKPANILLRADGSPLLADFGLARPVQPEPGERITVSGALVGTLAYMAPEQLRGAPVDARADIYALGVVLYELLTGRLPFEGDSGQVILGHLQADPPRPRALAPTVPTDVERLVLRMLAKEPAQRPASAAEVGRELFAALDRGAATGPTITAPTFAVGGGAAARVPRAGLLLGALGLIGICVVLGALALRGVAGGEPASAGATPAAAATPQAIQAGGAGLALPDDLVPVPLDRLDVLPVEGAVEAGAGQERFSVGGVTRLARPDALWFFGAVRNDGDVPREGVEIRVLLLDAAGAELVSTIGFAGRSYLGPGDTSPFVVLFNDDDGPLPEYASYRFEVRSRAADFELRTTVRELAVEELVIGQLENSSLLQAFGRVRNEGDRPAQFVEVVVVLLDAERGVVGVMSGFADSDGALAPGAAAPVEASWSTLSGEPASAYIFAEGKDYD